ncbi:MAG: cytochrome c oxidase subunit 3 [Verrucomicrobiales bacterium]|nr:cytochrome c oxidase subunit 3 [Verrucomicrobiales bacterium]
MEEPVFESANADSNLLTPPGGFLVWVIVLVEFLTFGMGLAVFEVMRRQEPEVFRVGQTGLNHFIAFANTLILLTGGWLMANAVEHLRENRWAQARRGTLAAAACGLVFLVLKGSEYAEKLRHGDDLHRDTFHTLYWLLTGFHYLHVLVAVVLLLVMARALRNTATMNETRENVGASAIFWHLCDLVWLLLLPVVYLLR